MPHCADSSYKHTEKAEIWEQRHNIWFSTTGMVSLKENGNKTHFTWEAWNISHKQRKMFCHNRLLCSAYHCQSCTNPTALSQVYFLITNSQIFFLSEQQRMLAVSVQCRPPLLSPPPTLLSGADIHQKHLAPWATTTVRKPGCWKEKRKRSYRLTNWCLSPVNVQFPSISRNTEFSKARAGCISNLVFR